MKTVYVIKASANNINFEANASSGLHFIESSVDLTFLDGVIFWNRVRIHVNQKVQDQLAGRANLWFLLISDMPLNNESLEKEWGRIKRLGHRLFKMTRLCLAFSYKDIYTIPNVDNSWAIENTYINLHPNGGFKEAYCIDRNKPIGMEGDDVIYEANIRSVTADLIFCVGSDTQFTQSQFVHITLPSTSINIDSSNLRVTKDVNLADGLGLAESDESCRIDILLELYNNALTASSIMTSFILMYQIVDLIIDAAHSTRIDQEIIDSIENVIKEERLIEASFLPRIHGALMSIKQGNIKKAPRRWGYVTSRRGSIERN